MPNLFFFRHFSVYLFSGSVVNTRHSAGVKVGDNWGLSSSALSHGFQCSPQVTRLTLHASLPCAFLLSHITCFFTDKRETETSSGERIVKKH